MVDTFCMLCCAHGAEAVVRDSIAAQGWRLAFSRPGFVTAKHDQTSELPEGVFIRTASHSIGSVRGNDSRQLIGGLLDQLAQQRGEHQPYDQLHVWPRDRLPIGRFDFEPGTDEVSAAVAEELFTALRERWLTSDAPNRTAQPGDRVLDVVLVEPSHWFCGTHVASRWPTRWPGGVQPVDPTIPPVSRAYFKAAEAIPWSGFDFRPGDLAIEIGSAPGGACGRLLELGLYVIGIDPAEMDPRIAEHPRFKHLRARAGDLPRREFRGAKWLLVDSNVQPDKTLTTVEHVVGHRESSLVGMLLTMKLGRYETADLIDRWTARVRRWNPQRIEVRQLARNKCEVCFAIEL